MLVFLSHDGTLIKCIHVRYQMKVLVIRTNMKFESHFYLDLFSSCTDFCTQVDKPQYKIIIVVLHDLH